MIRSDLGNEQTLAGPLPGCLSRNPGGRCLQPRLKTVSCAELLEVIELTVNLGVIDSKYRFIILAAKRARQLMQGATPKIATTSKRPATIAQAEVAAGLIDYEVLEPTPGRIQTGRKDKKQAAQGAKERKSANLAQKIAS